MSRANILNTRTTNYLELIGHGKGTACRPTNAITPGPTSNGKTSGMTCCLTTATLGSRLPSVLKRASATFQSTKSAELLVPNARKAERMRSTGAKRINR